MRRLNQERRGERGVTIIFIAMSMTLLIGAVGLGVDTTSLRFERSKFQHAADASALAIANDCANSKPECAGYQLTADKLTVLNSSASSPAVALTLGTQQVKVTVSKFVSTPFFKALGFKPKPVSAVAKARWTKNPISGPIIPFAISLCEYVRSTAATPHPMTLIRTDINDAAKRVIVPNGNTLAVDAYNNMSPYLAPACNVPADVTLPGSPSSVTMLSGGLWLSDAGNSLCNGKLLSTVILQSLSSITAYNETCSAKFAAYLGSGKMMLFAIYGPTSNPSHSGLQLNGNKAAFPGQFDMRLVGYAPFVVSKWCFSRPNGTTVDCGGSLPYPSSPGIYGQFVSSTLVPPKLDGSEPDFVFGDAGADFGSVKVELVD